MYNIVNYRMYSILYIFLQKLLILTLLFGIFACNASPTGNATADIATPVQDRFFIEMLCQMFPFLQFLCGGRSGTSISRL